MKDEFRVHFSCVLLALSLARPRKTLYIFISQKNKHKAKQWQH